MLTIKIHEPLFLFLNHIHGCALASATLTGAKLCFDYHVKNFKTCVFCWGKNPIYCILAFELLFEVPGVKSHILPSLGDFFFFFVAQPQL